tara:strand:+ start:31 stop:429 length:399 start_codon:yes stop_codon:yes gene_type:complete
MDLRILEIASYTDNNKVIKKFTHKSKHKNPLCGDEIEISLVVKNDIVKDIGYQSKSCIYCQASVSLLSRRIKNMNTDEIKMIISYASQLFDEKNISIKMNLKEFKEILNKKNLKRKDCLMLPIKALAKALNK